MAEYTKVHDPWADYPDTSTPLTAADLDTIESGIANAVAKDAVTVAGTRLVSTKLLSADTYPAFKAMGDGKLWWGAGGSSDVDTNLYRSAANILKTDDAFQAASYVYAYQGAAEQVILGAVGVGNAGIYFGSAQDTSLRRSSANTLWTDSNFVCNGSYLYLNDLWVGNISASNTNGVQAGVKVAIYNGSGVRQGYVQLYTG